MKAKTHFLLSALIISSAITTLHDPRPPAQPPAQRPAIYSSMCDTRDQTFYVQEVITDRRHVSLSIAKADRLPPWGIYRLLVFTAAAEKIQATDSELSARLVLTFSSDSGQYDMIGGAKVTLATEGETGPIIESFSFLLNRENGGELQIVEEGEPVACVFIGEWRAPAP